MKTDYNFERETMKVICSIGISYFVYNYALKASIDK